MDKMKFIAVAVFAVVAANADAANKVTYRDAQGRITGTSTTDRYGKTTYRDAQGRIQGSKK